MLGHELWFAMCHVLFIVYIIWTISEGFFFLRKNLGCNEERSYQFLIIILYNIP